MRGKKLTADNRSLWL